MTERQFRDLTRAIMALQMCEELRQVGPVGGDRQGAVTAFSFDVLQELLGQCVQFPLHLRAHPFWCTEALREALTCGWGCRMWRNATDFASGNGKSGYIPLLGRGPSTHGPRLVKESECISRIMGANSRAFSAFRRGK